MPEELKKKNIYKEKCPISIPYDKITQNKIINLFSDEPYQKLIHEKSFKEIKNTIQTIMMAHEESKTKEQEILNEINIKL
jgi:hypothetical protein